MPDTWSDARDSGFGRQHASPWLPLTRRHHRLLFWVICLGILLVAPAGFGAPGQQEFPTVGEWPSFRANKGLDGRTSVTGQITQPRIAWSMDLNPVETPYVLDARCGVSTATVGRSDAATAPGMDPSDPRWGLQPPAALIAGTSTPLSRTTGVTYADVFPEYAGLEKFEFDSGFDKPTSGGQYQDTAGRCLVWKDGQWVAKWESEPVKLLFSPLPIVGDFDRDGQPEVAILPWNDLLVFDARTGKIKDRCTFTEGRSYGAFHAEDVDGDGLTEFVVLADFVKHINVLGYRQGKLTQLWRREVEMTLDNPQRMMRAHPHPLADVNGDGRKELVVSLFNETGDHRWHVLVFNALTGAVLTDWPDEFMQGLADFDGDGTAEILTCRTHGFSLPEFGTIMVRSCTPGRPDPVWTADAAGWQTWEPPLAENANGAATKGREDVLLRAVNGRPVAVVRQPVGGDIRLSMVSFADGAIRTCASVRGERLTGLGMDDEGRLLFRSIHPRDPATGKPAVPTAEGGRLVAGVSRPSYVWQVNAPVVAREEGTTLPVIIAQDSAEGVLVLQTTHDTTSPPRILRRIPGRAQSVNWPETFGPVVTDLHGDGQRQIILSAASPEGTARLAVTSLEGRELWHHDFPNIPGTPPVWNSGGITLWTTGHFTDRVRRDVLVTVRRTIMHSDETYLVSGDDGRELWHRTGQIHGRGAGGQPYAVADYNGDGLDEAASLYPDLFIILNGKTGENSTGMRASWPQVPVAPVYWGIPVAGDFEGSGTQQVFFASGRTNMSMTGLVEPGGKLVWWDALEKGGQAYPAFGDIAGNGRTKVIATGFDDGMRCYDAATGRVDWSLNQPVAGNPAGSAAADLNGDGRDEAVFAVGKTLFCVGCPSAAGKGALLWSIVLPDNLGPPAIADADGSGHASILVGGTNGVLYCIR